MNKEIQFTSYDSQGPTDFDYVGFHLDTIKDIEQVFEIVRNELGEHIEPHITSEKFDEITQYLQKLKRYISNGPIHIHHSETLPKGGMKVNTEDIISKLKGYSQSLGDDEVNPNDIEMKQYPRN